MPEQPLSAGGPSPEPATHQIRPGVPMPDDPPQTDAGTDAGDNERIVRMVERAIAEMLDMRNAVAWVGVLDRLVAADLPARTAALLRARLAGAARPARGAAQALAARGVAGLAARHAPAPPRPPPRRPRTSSGRKGCQAMSPRGCPPARGRRADRRRRYPRCAKRRHRGRPCWRVGSSARGGRRGRSPNLLQFISLIDPDWHGVCGVVVARISTEAVVIPTAAVEPHVKGVLCTDLEVSPGRTPRTHFPERDPVRLDDESVAVWLAIGCP